MKENRNYFRDTLDWAWVFSRVFGKYVLILLVIVVAIYLFVNFNTSDDNKINKLKPETSSEISTDYNKNIPEKQNIEPEQKQIPVDSDKKQIQAIAIPAQDILDEYEGNQIRADKKYLNKKLQVQGTIYKISKSPTDYTIIEIKGDKNSYKSIKCALLKSEEKKSLDFSKGDIIVLNGKCAGLPENLGYSDIIFLDCKIIR